MGIGVPSFGSALYLDRRESERVRKSDSPQRLHKADAGPQGAGRLPEPCASPEPLVVETAGLGGVHPQVLNQGQSPDSKGSCPPGWGSPTWNYTQSCLESNSTSGVLRHSSNCRCSADRRRASHPQTSSSLSETTLRTSARGPSRFPHLRGKLSLSSWEHHPCHCLV